MALGLYWARRIWRPSNTLICRLLLLVHLVICFGLVPALSEEFPEFTELPYSQVISHHAPVTLKCSANPTDAQIRWLYNGQPLDERRHVGLHIRGSNLHFHHAREAAGYDGEYRCTATTSLGTIISQPAVLSKPAVSAFLPGQDVRIVVPDGGYATLTCEPPESSPSAYVVFQTADGSLVDTSKDSIHKLPSGNLVVRNITSTSGTGEYRCVAVNPVSGHNRTSHKVIGIRVDRSRSGLPPLARIMPGMRRHVQVALGADVSLECPSYGHPDANITWSKLGGSLPIGRFNISDLGFIHIESVQYEDTGTYRCTSHGHLGDGGTDQVTLEVHTPPVVQVVRQPGKTVLVGDRVELVCSYGGLPKPSLTWYHNGRELASDNEGSLVLAKVTTADSGIYQCMATNILGTKYGILSLKVSSHPRVQPKTTEKLITPEKKPMKPSEDDKDNTQRKKNVRRDRKKNGRRKKPSMRDKRKKKKNGVGAQADAEKPKYAPSVPTVTQLSDRSVMLNWSVPDKGNGQTIKFFKVQFKEMHPEKGPWQTSDAHLTYDIRRFEVANLKVGASYKFRVLAVYEDDDNKNSANTNIFKLKVEPHAQARPPDSPPMIVEATPVVYQENYGIGVKWQYKAESASPIEGFIIFYKPFGSEEEDTEKRVLGAGIRSEVIRDLMANTDYRIQIRSFNMAGQSQYSNLVVKRTKPRGVTTVPDFGAGDLVPEIERSTDAPIGDRRSSETLEQPVILGIVLGALLLALFVLVTMCWWKQRQQKRRNLCNNQQQKFQDQSRCIFADTTHSKPNGGLYPANGSIPVANGHGPPHESHGHMNIDVNPLAEYDVQTNVHGDGRPKQFYGNGMNGNLARCNGEKTCSEVSCQHAGSNHLGCNGELAYMEHQKATYPMQHRTLPLTPNQPLHSFYTEAGSLGRPLNHEYSEPGDHELIHSSGIPHALYNKQNLVHSGGHHGQVRNFDYSWSRAYDQPRLDKSTHASMDRISSCYPAVVDFGVKPYPHQQKRLGAPSPTAHLPAQNFATVPGGLGCNMGNAMHGGKHKRRRKRPNSRDQVLREHAMKDQATNTDLSSNEGTFDFNNYCKSGSSSGSDVCGRNCDSSFANNGSLESMDDDSHSAVSSASRGSEPHLAANGPVSL